MLENLDKIMHFNFDACPLHALTLRVRELNQNLSAIREHYFCLNSLAKVNTQLLIYKYKTQEINHIEHKKASHLSQHVQKAKFSFL